MKLRNTKVRCDCCNYLYYLYDTNPTTSSFQNEAVAVQLMFKNTSKSYAYNLHNSFIDDKLIDKFESTDKTRLEGAIDNIIKWLDASQEHSKGDYREK